ncbi:hypothetical protein H5410_001478 [Solanum commersonii]|uniref:Leucine-rich repeat-containing N-terminal plant-type domain-containing protein n=1 Tax=Solanum commersonii TaxID=4109 RepID=A0A9J6AZB6_SOLCO|nr:hypothetical protein H5410_001478 [Solanum commersonii]
MGIGQLPLFLLHAFLCQLFGFSSSLFNLCRNDQALVLLQFKNMLTITPYVSYCSYKTTNQNIESCPNTVTWNTSTNCCSWAGVYCDETTGQVIELDLSCSQLQVPRLMSHNGTLIRLREQHNINKQLKPKFSQKLDMGRRCIYKSEALSSLKRLDLSRNDFSRSHISPKFCEFSSLTHLDLSDSNKTQLFGIFLARAFHLSNLKYLYLSSNPQLTVQFPTTKWNSSESLMELYLTGVNFIDKIPQSFSYLTLSRQLDMRSCNLSGSIPRPVWNLTNIEYLLLDNYYLEGPISLFTLEKLIVL